MTVTSYWQSLELLQAEMDRNTADFFFDEKGELHIRRNTNEPVFNIPAWSLGRLWELVGEVVGFYFEDTDSPEYILQKLITLYKANKKDE